MVSQHHGNFGGLLVTGVVLLLAGVTWKLARVLQQCLASGALYQDGQPAVQVSIILGAFGILLAGLGLLGEFKLPLRVLWCWSLMCLCVACVCNALPAADHVSISEAICMDGLVIMFVLLYGRHQEGDGLASQSDLVE